jgi:threonine dehydratase
MAGQGTVALELLEEVPDLDAIVTAVGGGGLLSGCAVIASAVAPRCRVYGVEPEAGNDVQRSLAKGEIVHIDVPRTIADGAQTQHAGKLTFPVMRALAAGVETVGDAQLVDAMRFLAERMKVVVEPTGCLAAAALLGGRVPLGGKRVGVVLSGGNIDLQRYAELLAGR